VTLHAQGEGFNSLQELPCVIGRKALQIVDFCPCATLAVVVRL
jgi:hypothetical protein